jgi:hypothetical protein
MWYLVVGYGDVEILFEQSTKWLVLPSLLLNATCYICVYCDKIITPVVCLLIEISDVRSCDDKWNSYWDARGSYTPSSYTTFLTTVADNYTLTSISYTYTCETTCGTICYAGTQTPLATSIETHTQAYTLLTSTADGFPDPKPTCSVGLADCLELYSSYSALSTAWSKARYATTKPPPNIPPKPTAPACSTCGKNRCTIDPMSVDLYYFPVTANVTRDMCASNPVGGAATRFPEYPNSSELGFRNHGEVSS